MFNLTEEQEERARRLHKESIVVDSCGDGPVLFPVEYNPGSLEKLTELVKADAPWSVVMSKLYCMHTEDLVSGRSDITREWMELGGVDVTQVTVAHPGTPFERAMETIAHIQRKIDALDYLVKATTFNNIKQAKAQGKYAIIMGFQDSEHFGRDLDKLQCFYDLGIRVIQLTYNLRNFVGSGCTERADGGLSLFGVEAIKRMNELGILVDVSHCGYQTMTDAIEVSSAPVAVTHAFSRKLYDHDRGKTDEQIQALAAKNGYFGVVTLPCFLRDVSQKQASLDDVLDHIDHVARIMGVDKVGIGTDALPAQFPKVLADASDRAVLTVGFKKEHKIDTGAVLQGFEDFRKWPNVTRGLVSRGYTDEEIKGILGGNFLRIFKEVCN